VAVEQSIIGQEDSTLLTQIKLSRQDTNDRLDRLQRSHTEFAQKLADNNSKALIQALQQVIRDFNTKISEQFGENFKQLNVAVGRLLQWQESYRSQMSEMVQQQSLTSANMSQATERYAALVGKAETFSEISSQLSNLLTGLETQRTHLEGTLRSLAELVKSASDGLPQIEGKITKLTEQIADGVRHNQEQMSKTVRDSAVSLQAAIGDAKNLLVETTQTANRQINDHMKELAEKTTAELVKLDAALENELSKSISSLGRQLTALSSRFVEDYTPLTDRLRALIQGMRGA
jgi:chromosome segregation ATPase